MVTLTGTTLKIHVLLKRVFIIIIIIIIIIFTFASHS